MTAYDRDSPHGCLLQDAAGQREIVTSPTHPCAIYWVSTTSSESNSIQRNSYKDYARIEAAEDARWTQKAWRKTSRTSTLTFSLKEWIVTGQRSMHPAKLWGWDTDASNVYNGRRVLRHSGGGSKSWTYTASCTPAGHSSAFWEPQPSWGTWELMPGRARYQVFLLRSL